MVDAVLAARTDPSASTMPALTGAELRTACWSSSARRSAAERSGATAAISAATPATCGAAIDVPDLTSYPPLVDVEKTSTPGAPTGTVSRP